MTLIIRSHLMFFSLFLWDIASSGNVAAQNNAGVVESPAIKVSYRYSHPVQTMRSAEADITNSYILLTDGSESKFYSPRTEYIDSIESTPEGFEAFNTFKRVCYEKKQSDLIPRADGSFYIAKNFKSKSIKTYDVASATQFKWSEPMAEINWTVSDSTKNILDYECFCATTVYHGRNWTVWFAPEIPVSDGPWKLSGLPGMILEAVCEGAQYSFVCDGIEYESSPNFRIYTENKWDDITGKDFWKLRRECLDNPAHGTGTSGNRIVYKSISYQNYLPRNIVDYIETDY